MLDDLGRAGYRFDPTWFAAQREFRFPFYGAVDHGGVQLELRHALEPWHVLGEEASAGGTARFVDSSVERLQVKVEGLTARRHIVACNGRRLPLVADRTAGRIRRRRALQGVEAALVAASDHRGARAADLRHHRRLELAARSAVASTTSLIRAGASYDTFPVNSYEAEARRRARFQDHGHTPGLLAKLPPSERSIEYPTTLDLRRPL